MLVTRSQTFDSIASQTLVMAYIHAENGVFYPIIIREFQLKASSGKCCQWARSSLSGVHHQPRPGGTEGKASLKKERASQLPLARCGSAEPYHAHSAMSAYCHSSSPVALEQSGWRLWFRNWNQKDKWLRG